VQRVGVVDGVIGGDEQFASLAALFPHIRFELLGAGWPDRLPARLDLVLVAIDAAHPAEVEAAVRRLRAGADGAKVVAVVRHAEVATMRLLMREGCADVLAAPVSEASLALSLDNFFAPKAAPASAAKSGQVVALLKAGGGVGATALAVQMGAILASKGQSVCVADLDLQFGAASLYLDMPEAATVSDCLAAGSGLKDMALHALLSKHRSGLSLLAAPRQLTPLETLAPTQTEALLGGLKRDFALTILDLPSVWTAWTNRALQLADRIVVVTHLSVPHMHMLDRQLAVLKTQGLENRNLTLVCNALSPEQTALLSVKAAERALSREFTVVVPEDRKVMGAALNQGLELSAVRRGTKLEKAVNDLAGKIGVGVGVPQLGRR
jgi:pilus assembly protein CpaE